MAPHPPGRPVSDSAPDAAAHDAAQPDPRRPEPADHVIHLRVTRSRKGRYVRAARPRKLAEWIVGELDAAAAKKESPAAESL